MGLRKLLRRYLGIDDMSKEIRMLERTSRDADENNSRGIEFLLRNVKINTKDLFEPYRHLQYEAMPYYLKILFNNKYDTSLGLYSKKIYYKGKTIGTNNTHLVELYEKMKAVDDELQNKQ